MIVSAFHDGHGTYGLRVLAGRVGLWFRPEWRWVTVHLPGERTPACLAVGESFWGEAPVLRSARLKEFFDRNGLLPWDRNRPPHFELEPAGGGVFRLRWLERFEAQPRLLL
jgi:hypothetical protein